MQLVLENVTPATRLLEKRRQMFEVQEALEEQKQDYARKVWTLARGGTRQGKHWRAAAAATLARAR